MPKVAYVVFIQIGISSSKFSPLESFFLTAGAIYLYMEAMKALPDEKRL